MEREPYLANDHMCDECVDKTVPFVDVTSRRKEMNADTVTRKASRHQH
jgi:hypothetical protein